jgi:hypothetical protein
MGEVTRQELAAMTDQERLAYEREHHGDPYMSLLKANGMQRVALQFWQVGAARTTADREAQAQARRRLLQKLFAPCTGFGCVPWVFEIAGDVRTSRRSRC